MNEFYRVQYFWMNPDAGGYQPCPANDANLVIVSLPSESYGFTITPFQRQFNWPKQKRECNEFIEIIQRAYKLGQDAKAKQVGEDLRRLCGIT